MTAETHIEIIEHIRFQLDLLKLTGMSVELTDPSIMQAEENQSEAVRVVRALQTAVEKHQLRS